MGGSPLMRLVLAARLSQLTRGCETGIDTRDEDARDWALRTEHTIVGVCADDISGTVSPFKRKNLGPWLTDPNRMAMYDGILITKIDRLTRERDWGIRQWAERNGKKILCVSPELVWPPEPGDTTTAMQWDLLVNIAASEWTNTSQRYKRMLKAKRDQGFFTGSKPYGYQIEAVDGGKILTPDLVTAPIVRGMAKRYLGGQSFNAIAAWLTASAIPGPYKGGRTKPGFGWSGQTVKNILTSPAVVGRIQVKGQTVHRAEPLISADEHQRIQDTAASRSIHKGQTYARGLLTSILTCPNGHHMYRWKSTSSKLKPNRYYYYCTQCPKGKRPFVWCDDMDKAVDDAVMQMGDAPHIVTVVEPGDTYGEEINLIKKEIAALDFEADDALTKAAALREEIKVLRSKPRKPAKITPTLDGKLAGEVWEALDTAGKRQWLLARKGSNWLPDQTHVNIQYLGRDPETGMPIVDIDLGELTESFEALRRL